MFGTDEHHCKPKPNTWNWVPLKTKIQLFRAEHHCKPNPNDLIITTRNMQFKIH